MQFFTCLNLKRASLVAQLIKNPPAMWETWVQSLGWEDPLEKGKANYSPVFWARESHGLVHEISKSWTWLSNCHFHFLSNLKKSNNLENLKLHKWLAWASVEPFGQRGSESEEAGKTQASGPQRDGQKHQAEEQPRASQVALVVKNPPVNVGDVRDTGSMPGLWRSPREGNGNPLQYSCLENAMERGAWWAIVHGVTKSRIQLKRLGMHEPKEWKEKHNSQMYIEEQPKVVTFGAGQGGVRGEGETGWKVGGLRIRI